MQKKIIILFIVVGLPFAVGLWAGYGFGHRRDTAGDNDAGGYSSDPSAIKQAGYYQSATRDSISSELNTQRSNAITRAVAMASPAVVGINVTEVREYQYQDPLSQLFGNDPFFRQYFGDRTIRQEVKGLGSGFIVSPDGYILTNDHVAGNAKEVTITLTNKEKYKAKLVGTDMVSDICLLKIEGKNFPYLRLGNSDDVIIGEWVIAMGNPFGLFEISDKPTVTVGVVSATGMNLSAEGGRYYHGMIQTDAAINSGNSGGPLINSLGEVIGVNSVIFSPNQGNIGLGFAIPINRVKNILSELKSTGKIERNFWTGLNVQSVDYRVARYFGLDKVEGVIVSDVEHDSPGERSGFRVGDIIVEINGERIANEDVISTLLAEAKAGDTWKIKVLREKKYFDFSLKLERRSS